MLRNRFLAGASLLIPLLFALSLVVTATPARAQDCIVPAELTKTRPDPEGPPTRVEVGVMVLDIIELGDTTQLFIADFAIAVKWRDPRLSAENIGYSLESCRLGENDIWNPIVDLVNQRSIREHYQNLVDVDADGNVRMVQRYSGELVAPLHLEDFPFDRQVLPISVMSLRFRPDQVELVFDEQFTDVSENLSLAGWTAVGTEKQARITSMMKGQVQRPGLDFRIIVERDTSYYIWNVFVPLLLIVFMAWTVFWINPEHFGPQVALSTAATFTLIAFLLTLRQMVPPLGYLTRADRLVLICAVLVFSALGEAVLTSRLAKDGKEELALRIDRWARVVYPVLFVAAAVRSLIF